MNKQEQILYMHVRLFGAVAENWQNSLAEVMHIFTRYDVPGYIAGRFEIFNVQGDETNFEEIENYFRAKGAVIC